MIKLLQNVTICFNLTYALLVRRDGLIMKKMCMRLCSCILSLAIIFSCVVFTGVTAEAATKKTGIGLAEFGLKAYRDGWLYNYGSWGELSGGSRRSDCSGLIYAYLCWKDDKSNPVHDWSMPRAVMAQVKASSKSGPISTLPRTHGLLLTIDDYDHIGIYVGNNKSVDNSDYGVNMRYLTVSNYEWVQWHKLDSVSYPTNGWYKFDGSPFYYQNGEYVINTTKTIDGVKYKFDSSGKPSPTPKGYTNGSGSSSGGSSGDAKDKVSIAARTTTDVNLRIGAGTGYSIIKTIPENTSITITNKDNSSWYKVKTKDNLTGYMSSEYIKAGSAAATPKPTAKPAVSIKAKATAAVNLRKSASMNGSVIKVIPNGTVLTIIEKTSSSWYKVKLSNGTVGYIYSSYLKAVSSSSGSSSSVSIKGYTTTDVNIRKGAGTSYGIIKTLSKNTALTITSKSNKSWYKAKLSDGTAGYISSDYIKEGTVSTATSIKAYTTAVVNLRKGAGTGYSVIKVLPKNTNLTITSKSNKSWYKVKLSNGTAGYISSSYLKSGTATAASSGSSSVSIKATTTTNLNMRKGAGTGYSVITTLSKGTAVTITDKTNKEWYKIKTSGGKTGYASSQYLKTAAATKTMTTTADVNLRKSASMSGSVITVVAEKTKVTVTSTANKSWYKVKLSSGKTGYISSQYLK